MPTINTPKINKRVVIISAIVALIALSLGIFLLIRSNQNKNTITITTTTPVDNSSSVGLYDPVSIEFNGITAENQKGITYKFDPDITTTSSWKSDQILTITASPSFGPSLKYKLSILFNNKLVKQISFNTKTSQELTEVEKLNYQSQSDFFYSQTQQQQYADKPWVKNLPIDNTQYEAIYDATKNDIFVRLRDKTLDVEVLKKQVRNKLISIGVPQDFPIEWVLPQP